MKYSVLILVLVFTSVLCLGQNYTPFIEECPCLMKIDTRLKSKCGFLVVPENRKKPNANKVKIPFVFSRRADQDSAKNITLFTTGGPGYATISVGDSLRYTSDWLAFGGIILFDQRGTKNAVPALDCEGIDEAIRNAYLYNLPVDSLKVIAVANCRKKFVEQGIDLSSYNTVESAADISDLKETLHIDSITLFGTSYSGGLMLTVARNHPKGIKSLLLNSPLPGFVNYEEHALFNHNEAMDQLFENIERDSIQNSRFPELRQRFRKYFTDVSNKIFTISYQEKGKQQKHQIRYSKNELLDAIFNRMNNADFKTVPEVILNILNGQHENYVLEVLNEKFAGNKNLYYGMRLSVYCSEQIAYSDPVKIKKQDSILPWLAGYSFNNVNHKICDCWDVRPEAPEVKTPVYSQIPALVTAGALDPWTRPFYNDLIKRTMPNAQSVIIKDRAHGAGFGNGLLPGFINNPYKKLYSNSENVIVD